MDIKRKLGIYLRSIRAMRTMHWIFMVLLGFIIRPDEPSVYDFLIPAIAVIFMWQYTTMINDIYDLDIDRKAHPDRPLVRGEISVSEYGVMANISLGIGLGISFLAGPYTLFMNMLFYVLAVLYSKPPFRIRNRWWGTAVMGSASAIEVAAGYLSHIWFTDLNILYAPEILWIFPVVLVIVFFALSVAPNITAYEDYEGDMEAGVSTIYTVLGKERGKKLISTSLFILFLLPLLLLHSPADTVVSFVLGILAVLSFQRFSCSRCVFTLYFLELLYFMAIFMGISGI